ncbi:adenosine (5')-pentaphospho-(5'')-adenosine pyrophosphohydrolase [Burkholderia phage BCSR129]|nr:adenosine (5')-pentaphospho-(5'')-adenosine pyrophosphohydrolase [Burkholderia phage BCSR129]
MTTPKAAGILYLNDGKILLIRRSAGAGDWPGHWALPGGGIDDGETPEQAAVRESEEEVSRRPSAPLVHLWDCPNGFVTFGAKDGAFEPSFDGIGGDEHDAWGWFGLGELPNPLHPEFKKGLFNKIAEGILLKRLKEKANASG